MIQLKNATKVFRSKFVETTALNAIDLDIRSGEFVSVMGPSGCGKSTLLGILGLLDCLSAGQYWFDGKDVSDASEQQMAMLRRHRIGFVFQQYNLINSISVLDNVLVPLRFSNKSAQKKRALAMQALERVKMTHRARHKPPLLSGGQQQRVATARSIVHDPDLVLADEPTGNLDSELGGEVMDLLSDIHADGRTVILVTHSQQDAGFAQRIIRMEDGKVHADGKIPVHDM